MLDMLQSMGSQRVGHDWVTEQQQLLVSILKKNTVKGEYDRVVRTRASMTSSVLLSLEIKRNNLICTLSCKLVKYAYGN